jgi:hypothetical protein
VLVFWHNCISFGVQFSSTIREQADALEEAVRVKRLRCLSLESELYLVQHFRYVVEMLIKCE